MLVVIMKVVLFFVLLCGIVSADVCIPAQHRIYGIEDSKTLFGRRSSPLLSNVSRGFYRSMVLDEKTNRLFIGGKNSLAVVDATSFELLHNEPWKVDNTDKCLNSGLGTTSNCNNYVTHLNIYKNKLVACGSGALSPVYKVLSLNNYTTVKEKQQSGICASPNPDHRIVGQVTGLGEMIAGTYIDVDGTNSKVVGSYVTEKMTQYRENLDTNKKDIKAGSEFVASFYRDDRVYVFFMEAAEESGDEITATVGRYCQTDNGGQTFISSRTWTTYRKARLNCKYDGVNEVIFKNLVDVVYDEKKKLFYASYTMTKHESLASAICTFTFDEVKSSFNKDFLERDINTEQWKVVNGPKFLNGCEVNRTLLEGPISPTSVGKEPTNNLDLDSSMFLSQHRLMATQIKSRNDIFQYMKPITRFSRILVDRLPNVAGNGHETIISVIDEKGRILVIHGPSEGKPTCVIEEVETGIVNPKKFIMNEKKRLLYVSSDDDLMAYDVDSCQRYSSREHCIDAGNPRCGWSQSHGKCLSWVNRGNATLTRNLTHCPKRLGIFSSWSVWRPQQQDGSQRFCMARHRQCRSCDIELCDVATMEITNCTVNTVVNMERWLKEGAIDGAWSSWSEWSSCQQHGGRCGNNTMSRSRQCDSPRPLNGGKDCIGSNFECKTCPRKKEIIHVFWSEWENWSDCTQQSGKLTQSRKRLCSKPGECREGKDTETRECPPSGIIWNDWTECSCVQRVQHRYPKFITGCSNSGDKDSSSACPRLNKPEYRKCDPVGCPTPPDTGNSNNNNTNKTTEVIDVIPVSPNKVPVTKEECKDGYTFQLIELISIGIGIIASCFVIVIVIVLLIIRRDRKKNGSSYSPHEIRKTKSQPLLEATDTLDSNSRESNA